MLLQVQLYSQIRIDSFLQKEEIDSSILSIQLDAMGDYWKIYPEKIIRMSKNNSFNDSFSSFIIKEGTHIDSKFPLKSLFYNSNTNKINIINSRWGSLSEIQLDRLNIYEPALVDFSSDGMIWILDKNANVLSKINDNATSKFKIQNPFSIQGKYYYPQCLIDYKYFSIAIDSNFGLFIIDNYGNLISKFQVNKNAKIYYSNTELFLIENDKLFGLKYTEKKALTRSQQYFILSNSVRNIVEGDHKLIILYDSKHIVHYDNSKYLLRQ